MEEPILKVSLKDYKKQIDELRASLLSLESTSAEYKSTAEEIRERQSKLNEVMSVGKADVDAVAGSYNALNKEMIALKKEWKNMEIGTDEWKAMAAQINSLNDQLKDADALTGNFQRNVGDYANAFGAAFDKAAGELGKMSGPLGTIFKTTKNLIPVIKTANKTATTGLAGVKKAIVSTGIGALVVAVGLLVAHWGDLVKLFRGGKSAAEEAEEANNKLNESFEKQNFEMEQQTRIMQAQGVENSKIIATKLNLIRTQIAQKKAQLEENKATYEAIAAHTWLGRVLRGEQSDYKELKEIIEKQKKELEELTKSEVKLQTDATVETENKKTEAQKKAEERRKKEVAEANKILEDLSKRNKTEERLLTEKYEKDKALLKKYHKDTTALTKQYQQDLLKLRSSNGRAQMEGEDALFDAQMSGRNQDSKYWAEVKKYFEERQKKIFEIQNKVEKNLALNGGRDTLSQAKIDKIYQLITGYNTEAEFISAAKDVMDKVSTATDNIKKETINERLADTSLLVQGTGVYFKALADNARTELNAIKEMGKLENESQEQFNQRVNTAFENLVEANKAVAEFRDTTSEVAIAYAELNGTLAKGFISAGMAANKALAEVSLENYYDVMDSIVQNVDATWADAIKGFEKGSEEWKNAVYENIAFFPEDARSTFIQKLLAVKDAEKLIIEERAANWQSLYSSIDSTMSSISDIMNASIQAEKERLIEQGKTEEEANKIVEGRFESMKAFQIAQAVINTIAGAVGAFMGITRDTGGWGIAAAIAEAAAVTAAGIAQIEKIRNTSIGKTSSLDASSVSVTPSLADYTPDRTANITSASDTDNLANAIGKQNIYVKVSDIDRAQKKVQVREGESRF